MIPNMPLPNEVRDERPAPRFELPDVKDWRIEREQQKVRQADLLEALRAKGYARRRTLAAWSYAVRDGVRSGTGPWYWTFIATMAAMAYFIRL